MRLPAMILGFAALSAGLALPADAASVSTKVAYDQAGPGGVSQTARTDDAATSASNSLVTPGGSGSAYAEIGLLRVGAFDAPITIPVYNIYGTRTEATALWQDRITLVTPGAASGIATFSLQLAASTFATGTRPYAGNASADVVLAINNVTYLDVSSGRGFPLAPDYRDVYRLGQGSVTDYGDFEITGTYLVQVPFVSGVAFNLRVQSVCSAFTHAEVSGFTPLGYGSAGCDMTHTTRWGGLASIVNGNGASLGNAYSIASQNGFDYAAQPQGAVPEPASWAMLLLGFGLVGGLQRRGRHTLIA